MTLIDWFKEIYGYWTIRMKSGKCKEWVERYKKMGLFGGYISPKLFALFNNSLLEPDSRINCFLILALRFSIALKQSGI